MEMEQVCMEVLRQRMPSFSVPADFSWPAHTNLPAILQVNQEPPSSLG